ncbi:sal-like protein 1 [Cydia pomonella]|uniref:sal-like protein 1 n=1 Tax=Cydia pomonella TaxID=82600 RepID=UPI002ADE1BC5|nr:sal-like protein 1 [Cydia pomonella]
MKPGKSGAGAKKKKPYYLNEVMQFTLPFIKLSTESVSGNLVSPPINETNQPDVYDDITDDEDGSQSILANFNNSHTSINQISTEHEPIPSPQSPTVPTPSPQSRPLPTPSPHLSTASEPTPSPASMTSNLSSKKKTRKTKNSVDECIVDYFKAKQAKAETAEDLAQNPKTMFLLSLLPDLELEPMSDSQMRKFKRGVMQLIDEILEDKPKPTTTASVADSNITLYYETIGQDFTTPVVNNI